MPKTGLRLLAIGVMLAASTWLAAPPAEAKPEPRKHHAQQGHKRHATQRAHKTHMPRATHHARKAHPTAEAHGSISGLSTSCLPAILRTRLAQVAAKFGHIEVVSANRPGATMPNGRTSFHSGCRAVDFNPPRGKYNEVANWLKANHDGGVGTYSCGMHHIHIDNGPHVRFHHCQ